MYHDATPEATVVVRRRRPRLQPLLPRSGNEDASQRLIEAYQLRHVADFLLKGSKALRTAHGADRTGRCGSSGNLLPSLSCACDGKESRNGDGTTPFMRVALQFPDELLGDAVAVVQCLQEIVEADPRYSRARLLGSSSAIAPTPAAGSVIGLTLNDCAHSVAAPAAVSETGPSAPVAAFTARPPTLDNPHCPADVMRLFVLADNTFGSCCPDEITAQHYMADCIVHFGYACMSPSTRLPVLYVQSPFHFRAIITAASAVASPAHEMGQCLMDCAEVATIIEVTRRVARTAHSRLERWWSTQVGNSGSSSAAPCPLRARLSVVGTYATRAVMQSAQGQWLSGEAELPVDWPLFEEYCGIPILDSTEKENVQVQRSLERGSMSTTGLAATSDSFWMVNGVRFPRLAPSDAHSMVQYILFVGARGSSALVHVFSADQYNCYHYGDTCREYLQWDDDTEEYRMPTVCMLDDSFGDGGAGARQRESLGLALRVHHDASAATKVKEAVGHWVSEALGSGVASSLVNADYLQAQQTLQRRVRQRAFNIESVRASAAIGILVASLSIQGYYEVTQQLHQLIRAYGKRSYVIYVGHLNEFKLANFVDTVDCFVVVACPYSRPSHFPEKKDGFMKPIVSPAEVLVALTMTEDADAQEQYGMASMYTTSFDSVLTVLKEKTQRRRSELEERALATEAEADQKRKNEEERWASSGALVRTTVRGSADALTVHGNSQGALARLYEREYIGLDPRIGQTPIQQEVVQGKHGIARGYAKERDAQGASDPPPPAQDEREQ